MKSFNSLKENQTNKRIVYSIHKYYVITITSRRIITVELEDNDQILGLETSKQKYVYFVTCIRFPLK